MSWTIKAATEAVKFLIDIPDAKFYAYDGSEDENGFHPHPIKAGDMFEIGHVDTDPWGGTSVTADTGGSCILLEDFKKGVDYAFVPMAEYEKAIAEEIGNTIAASEFAVGDEVEFIEPHMVSVDIDKDKSEDPNAGHVETEHFDDVNVDVPAGTKGVVEKVYGPAEIDVRVESLPYSAIRPQGDSWAAEGDWSGTVYVAPEDIAKIKSLGTNEVAASIVVEAEDQVKMGLEAEKEHAGTIKWIAEKVNGQLTDDVLNEAVRKIVSDHLKERPDYYTRLKQAEGGDVKAHRGVPKPAEDRGQVLPDELNSSADDPSYEPIRELYQAMLMTMEQLRQAVPAYVMAHKDEPGARRARNKVAALAKSINDGAKEAKDVAQESYLLTINPDATEGGEEPKGEPA